MFLRGRMMGWCFYHWRQAEGWRTGVDGWDLGFGVWLGEVGEWKRGLATGRGMQQGRGKQADGYLLRWPGRE